MPFSRTATVLTVATLLASLPAQAQCPDGTPPPCRGSTRPSNSVAVLYFGVRSSDPADSAFADGLTEAIIDELGSDPRLRVTSGYAVRRFHDAQPEPAVVGRTLGVGSLVTGVVQRVQGELLVRVELLSAATGLQLWREPYEGLGGDAMSIQRGVASRVAASVAGALTRAPRPARAALTADTSAYAAFLRGNGLLPLRTVNSSRRAIAEYERAVALDPRLTLAWARMAIVYANRLEFVDPVAARGWDTLVAAGMRAADRAVGLDPRSGEAWVARAYMLRFANPRTYAGVQAAFDRAFALAPHSAEAWSQYADFLDHRHRPGALDARRRALLYDPGRPSTLANVAVAVGGTEGLALTDSAIALAPSYPNSYSARSALLLQVRGDTAGARRDLETAAALVRADGKDDWDVQVRLALLAGDSAAARRVTAGALERARAYPVLAPIEGMLAVRALNLLGDREAAIGVILRIQPPGVKLYNMLLAPWATPLIAEPRIRARLEESRPPWATAR